MGDVWTLTVKEYFDASRWKRIGYRLSRNPVLLFVVAPLFIFFVGQRLTSKKANPRERRSVRWMNLAILGMVVGMSAIYGVGTYVFIQTVIMASGGAAGVWLFYVQHQFADAYWERHERWDYTTAVSEGKLLQAARYLRFVGSEPELLVAPEDGDPDVLGVEPEALRGELAGRAPRLAP